jgi:hypothetical protein
MILHIPNQATSEVHPLNKDAIYDSKAREKDFLQPEARIPGNRILYNVWGRELKRKAEIPGHACLIQIGH